MMRITDTVKHLIIINVIFFVATQFMGQDFIKNMALFYPSSPNFNYWQLITHMFMHGGVAHIAFNMFNLWALGSALEIQWGTKKFLTFYFLTGLGASLIYLLVNYLQFDSIYNHLIAGGLSDIDISNILTSGKYNTSINAFVSASDLSTLYSIYNNPALGASGAISGIMVGFAFKYPNVELMLMFIPFPIKAKYLIGGYFVIDLVMGLNSTSLFGGSTTGIAHFAHIGGAIIGYLLMLYFQKNQYKRWN